MNENFLCPCARKVLCRTGRGQVPYVKRVRLNTRSAFLSVQFGLHVRQGSLPKFTGSVTSTLTLYPTSDSCTLIFDSTCTYVHTSRKLRVV